MNIITRRFEFDAGHRVWGHEGKCASVHGHRYVLEITFSSEKLDHLGRVIDFGQLKEIIGTHINEMYDHRMLVYSLDDLYKEGIVKSGILGNCCILDFNPTAENLAEHFYHVTVKLLENNKMTGIQVELVKLWETPNCSATYIPEEEPAQATGDLKRYFLVKEHRVMQPRSMESDAVVKVIEGSETVGFLSENELIKFVELAGSDHRIFSYRFAEFQEIPEAVKINSLEDLSKHFKLQGTK